jgi:hypothetical protein
LKIATAEVINALLDPIRSQWDANEEWQRLEAVAYPEDQA